MKKTICVIVCFLMILCGCSQGSQTTKFDVGEFSYESDCSYYNEQPGVRRSDFVNTEKNELETAEQAVELAKKESMVEYDTIAVAFDSDLKIYKVSFYKEGYDGGNQDVYLGQDGVTLMSVSGE